MPAIIHKQYLDSTKVYIKLNKIHRLAYHYAMLFRFHEGIYKTKLFLQLHFFSAQKFRFHEGIYKTENVPNTFNPQAYLDSTKVYIKLYTFVKFSSMPAHLDSTKVYIKLKLI